MIDSAVLVRDMGARGACTDVPLLDRLPTVPTHINRTIYSPWLLYRRLSQCEESLSPHADTMKSTSAECAAAFSELGHPRSPDGTCFPLDSHDTHLASLYRIGSDVWHSDT